MENRLCISDRQIDRNGFRLYRFIDVLRLVITYKYTWTTRTVENTYEIFFIIDIINQLQ